MQITASLVESLILIIVIKSGLFGTLYHFLDFLKLGDISQGIVYFSLLLILSTLIDIPFALYNHFYLEQKYGFNRMNLSLFFMDKIKEIFISILLSSLLIFIIMYIWKLYPAKAWIIAFAITSIVIFCLQYLAPRVILPLFNKFTPLEDSPLKEKINKLAQLIGYQISHIYIMDGSKRSSKANAFLTGFGKNKKIALFDTLLQSLTEEEIVSVLAHELAHFKQKHLLKSMLMLLSRLFLFFYLANFFLNNPEISKALNFKETNLSAGLLGFILVFSALNFLLNIVFNYFSRKFEKEADLIATNYIHPQELISALKKLARNNLNNLTPHPLYVFFYYSHPPLVERINYLSRKEE